MKTNHILIITTLFLMSSCKPETTGQYMGAYQYAGPPPDIKIFFSNVLDSAVTVPPTMAKEKLIMIYGTKKGTLYAFNYRAATNKWVNDYNSAITSAPVIFDGKVYFGTAEGEFLCVDIETGNSIWKFRANASILADPVVDETGIYFGSTDNNFYALDTLTGQEKWRKTTLGEITRTALLYKDSIIFSDDTSGNLYALNKNNAEEKWIFKAKANVTTSPVAVKDTFYFGDEDKNLYALNVSDSKVVWETKLPETTYSTPSININKNRIYVASGNNILFLDIRNGKKAYEVALNGEIRTPLVTVAGFIYATDTIGKLYMIDETTRDVKWQHEGFGNNATPPYLFNGIVHYGTDEGILYALGRDEDIHIYSAIKQKTEDELINRRGNTQFRMAYNVASGSVPKQTLRRVYNLSETVTSSFAYGNNSVYVGAGNKLYSLRTDTNEVRWEKNTDGTVNSSPAFGNRIAFYATTSGSVAAIDPNNKDNTYWTFKAGGEIHSSPFIYHDMVYIGSDDGMVYAINSQGVMVWKFKTGGKVTAMPVFVNNKVYVGSSDGYMYAVNAVNGEEVWKIKTDGAINSTAAILGERLYFGTDSGTFYSLFTLNGKELWSYKTGGAINSSPAVIDNKVVFGSADKNIYALDDNSGNLLWKFSANGEVISSPTVVDNFIYIGSKNNTLYNISLDTGEKKWEFKTDAPVNYAPLVINGMVYVGAGNKVYALQ